jgi:hypothetical protein
MFYVHAIEYIRAFKRLSNHLFPSKCEYDHRCMFFFPTQARYLFVLNLKVLIAFSFRFWSFDL